MARSSCSLSLRLLLVLMVMVTFTITASSSRSGSHSDIGDPDSDSDGTRKVSKLIDKLGEAPGHGNLVGSSAEDGWVGFRARLLAPVTFTGTGKDVYDWNFMPSLSAPSQSVTWVQAKQNGGGAGTFVALGWTFPAADYWGQRVRLQAQVWVSKEVSNQAYAALFVMVLNDRADNVIVFDNMHGRPIQAGTNYRWGFPVQHAIGQQHEVVVLVPDPYEGDSCPAEDFISHVIHVGFVFCGGRGRVEVSDPRFGTVHNGVPLTGGWRPWQGPPEVWDYERYAT